MTDATVWELGVQAPTQREHILGVHELCCLRSTDLLLHSFVCKNSMQHFQLRLRVDATQSKPTGQACRIALCAAYTASDVSPCVPTEGTQVPYVRGEGSISMIGLMPCLSSLLFIAACLYTAGILPLNQQLFCVFFVSVLGA